MKTGIAIPTALIAGVIATMSSAALAQESGASYFGGYVPPPRSALELTAGTGYTQGFGQLSRNVDMQDVAQDGMGLDLAVGYRVDPHWMVGAVGEDQQLTAERAQTVRGAVAGFQVAYHLAPAQRLDPWVSLGSGYRWLWEVYDANDSTVLTQGLQMARLTLGLDWRLAREVSLGPVIGGDVDTFLVQSGSAISQPDVSVFVHAGIMGHFDLGGSYDDHGTTRQTAPFSVGVAELQGAPPAAPPPPPAPLTVVFVSPSVSVSNDILAACKLKLGNASEFGFDDSQLTSDDRSALGAISQCFDTGPLQGQRMRIVGHTDPRGTAQYNMDLGQRRAQAARDYVESAGVDTSRIETGSRGSIDAIGTDEAGWESDRRVDITVAP
jgi:outer membrane protein OmpA-like peptidoglycan-associated protein